MKGCHAYSQDRLGNVCPRAAAGRVRGGDLIPVGGFWFGQPWQVPLETDRAAVTARCRRNAHDAATYDTAAHDRGAIASLDLQSPRAAGEQPMRLFDQRAARRHID